MDQITPQNKRRKTSFGAPRKSIKTQTNKVNPASGSLIVKRVPRGVPVGCPREMRVKLRYHTVAVLAAPAAGVASYATYRANGPYDPEEAIGGGQPRYYDQWSAIYNQVTTVGAKCTVTFANELDSFNQFIGVAHSASNTPPGTPERQDFMEMNHVRSKLVAGENPRTVSLMWKPEQYFIGKTIYDEDIASQVASTPIRDCFFFVWTASQTSSEISNKSFNITLEYDVIFFDQKVPNKS